MIEGWIWPYGLNRYHYFRFETGSRSATSICGRAPMSDYRPLRVYDGPYLVDKCLFCTRELEREGD